MYKLIQDMAKFTEVTAAQHKNMSSELAEEASRITKLLPKIRQDLVETVRSRSISLFPSAIANCRVVP